MVTALKSIIAKCNKGAESDRNKKIQFNFFMVKSAAELALDFLIWSSHRQKVSNYVPNPGAAFCNKYPEDPRNKLFCPSQARLHILAGSRLVTVVELSIKNGLYDMLALVRDPNGAFVYRAQLMCCLEQISEFLQGPPEGEAKSESVKSYADFSPGERVEPMISPAEKLVSGKSIAELEQLEGDGLEDLIKAEVTREQGFLQEKKQETAGLERKYRKAERNCSDGSLGRILLQHFQFLNPARVSRISILREDARLATQLRLIDSLPVRERFCVPLLYLRDSDSPSYETQCQSDTYFNAFVGSLGVVLEPAHLRTGNFDHIKDEILCSAVVYSANCLEELAFLCPSLRSSGEKEVRAVCIHM